MQRRAFLQGLGALWLSGIGTAVARSPSALDAAVAAAREAGKPLLVLLVPRDAELARARGQRLGLFLNRASEAQLAPLAHAELRCASESLVRARFPGFGGAPLALIETDVAARASVPVAFAPRVTHPDPLLLSFPDRAEPAELARALAAEIAACELEFADQSQRLRAALWGDVALQRRRLLQVRQARGDAAARALEATSEEELGKAVAARWRAQAPAGARWATLGVCGSVEVEGAPEESAGAGCGMGSVPAYHARFLKLYVDGAH